MTRCSSGGSPRGHGDWKRGRSLLLILAASPFLFRHRKCSDHRSWRGWKIGTTVPLARYALNPFDRCSMESSFARWI